MAFSNRLARMLLGFGLACGFAAGNDIYLAQSAAGMANGSDCADAYSVSMFNVAGNWAPGAPIGPGTTVHLCGVLTAAPGAGGLLVFQGSGTSGSPITVRFEAGAVIQTSYWTGGGSGAILATNRSFLVIDGGVNGTIRATLAGSPGAQCLTGGCQFQPSNAGNGIALNSCSNVEIKNITISNLYVHTGNGNDTSGASQGVLNNDGSNISIHDNTIHDVMTGVWSSYNSSGQSNVSIFGNTIYNVNWGVAGGDDTSNATLSNLLVYGNMIRDFADWNTTSDTFHHNGIYFWAEQPGGRILSPVAFYNNNISGNFGGQYCTAGIFMSQGGAGQAINSPSIFNNVIDQSVAGCGDGVIALLNINSSPLIVNNTLVGGFLDGPNGTGSGAAAILKNNVWLFNVPGQAMYNIAAGIQSSDYNVWYNLSLNAFYYNSSWYTSLSAWTAGTGFDRNSTTANPFLAVNYQPGSGSSAIQSGTNLSADCSGKPIPGIGALCYDAAGNLRPPVGNWDMGAFQSLGTGRPAAPTSLSVRVN